MDEQTIIRRYAQQGWLKLRDDESADTEAAQVRHT